MSGFPEQSYKVARHFLQCFDAQHLLVRSYEEALGPAACDIGQGRGVNKTAVGLGASEMIEWENVTWINKRLQNRSLEAFICALNREAEPEP